MVRSTRDEEYATDAEVEAAIRALTEVEAERLSRVGRRRARMLTGLGLGMDSKDLLQEAIARTVAGDRRWRKKVPFVKHLVESMRSIANHARDELKGAAIGSVDPDGAQGLLGGVALTAKIPDAIQIAAAHEQLEQIAAQFTDDDEVGLVIGCLCQGMKGPQIQRDLGITEQEFETIVTRLRRGLDRKAGWRP